VHVAPKRLPFFKVGKDLRDRVNRAAGTGGLDESPDDDTDDDVVDLDEMDEPEEGGNGGNGRSHAPGGAGWNGGERPSEHRAAGEGRDFGQPPDRDSSDAG
jgi:hypothetical protein